MPSIPGIILAGGQARRMGGGDKALQLLQGQSLLSHVIARLQPQVSQLALNANGDPQRFETFGLPVVADGFTGHPGPLAGILAGLDWAAGLGADQIVTVAADTPFFPPDLVARLRQGQGQAEVTMAATPDPKGGQQRQPVFGLWPVSRRAHLRQALEKGMRKVGRWADELGVQEVLFANSGDPFFNINTVEDLQQAETKLALKD